MSCLQDNAFMDFRARRSPRLASTVGYLMDKRFMMFFHLSIVQVFVKAYIFMSITLFVNAHYWYTGSQFYAVTKQPTFVDKTMFLEYVIEVDADDHDERCYAFIAPRRIGKTTNFRMVNAFYGGQVDENGNILPQNLTTNYELFKNLKIGKFDGGHFMEKHFAKYPVLWIDLSAYTTISTVKSYDVLLRGIWSQVFEKHRYLLKSKKLDALQVAQFSLAYNRSFGFGSPDGSPFTHQDAITLIRLLTVHYGKKVIILIDEFDAPALSALLLSRNWFSGIPEDALTYLSQFFRPVLKGNDYVRLSLLTGINRIGETLSPEINNIIYISAFDNEKVARFYGFTEKDVKKIAGKIGKKHLVNDMAIWYDGYKVKKSNMTIYNTLSVTACFATEELKPYWEAAPGLSKLGNLFKYEVFGHLVEDSFYNPITILPSALVTKTNLLQFKALAENVASVTKPVEWIFFQYLLEQGYYTVVNEYKDGTVDIEIPNEEIYRDLRRLLFQGDFFEKKLMINRSAFQNYTDSLECLDGSKTSLERLKKSIANLFENRMPKKERELSAALFAIPWMESKTRFQVVRTEMYVKPLPKNPNVTTTTTTTTTEAVYTGRRNEKGKKNTGKRRYGSFLDVLVVKPDKDYSNYMKQEEPGLPEKRKRTTAIIIECKFDGGSALEALKQAVVKRYYAFQDEEIKSNVETIILIGLAWTRRRQWEMWVLNNSTDMTDAFKVE